MRHGYGKILVDTFIVVEQRRGQCPKCASEYLGPELEVECRGCGTRFATIDVKCRKKIATGVWTVTTMRNRKPKEPAGESGSEGHS